MDESPGTDDPVQNLEAVMERLRARAGTSKPAKPHHRPLNLPPALMQMLEGEIETPKRETPRTPPPALPSSLTEMFAGRLEVSVDQSSSEQNAPAELGPTQPPTVEPSDGASEADDAPVEDEMPSAPVAREVPALALPVLDDVPENLLANPDAQPAREFPITDAEQPSILSANETDGAKPPPTTASDSDHAAKKSRPGSIIERSLSRFRGLLEGLDSNAPWPIPHRPNAPNYEPPIKLRTRADLEPTEQSHDEEPAIDPPPGDWDSDLEQRGIEESTPSWAPGSPEPEREPEAPRAAEEGGEDVEVPRWDDIHPALSADMAAIYGQPPTREHALENESEVVDGSLLGDLAPEISLPEPKYAVVLTEQMPAGGNYLFQEEPTRLTKEIINTVLVWAARNNVSDVFFCSGNPIKCHIDGKLTNLTRRVLDASELKDLLDAFKTTYVPRMMQSEDVHFRHDHQVSRTERYSYRCAASACQDPQGGMGIELVTRFIPWETPTLEKLKVEHAIINAAFPNDGLILITGPTGSGKSTLLAALLREAGERRGKRVMTYEQPVEFNLVAIENPNGMFIQKEVGQGGHILSFPHGIANALRCKPDYILIGEAREKETIEGVIRAAETGHTVFSTVHTKGVVGTITRMADEFPPEVRWSIIIKLIDSMRLIVHQRLVTAKTGGRIAIREYLVFDEEMREEIIASGEAGYLRALKAALKSKGRPLLADVQEKFDQGLIHERVLASFMADRAG